MLKKLIVIVVACLVSVFSLSAQVKITTASLNVRAYPTTNSIVLDVLPQGTVVGIVNSLSNGWSIIVYNKDYYKKDYRIGYVYSSYLLPVKLYENTDGDWVPSPVYSPTVPYGATARCVDGTYSYSKKRKGTCSHHGGVAKWLQ